MTASATTKQARDASDVTGGIFAVGFQDESGIGLGPFNSKHAQVDSTGLIINPATNETLSQVALGIGSDGSNPPVLPGGSTGLRGWLRAILAAIPVLGAAPRATAVPVTMATDQPAIAVSQIIGGAALSATNRLPVDGSGVTQPISAAALPLPAGAVKETGGNLSAILASLLSAALPSGALKVATQSNALPLEANGNLLAVNSVVAVSAIGMHTAIIRLPNSAWTGAVVVEGTSDGINYDVPLNTIPYGGGTSVASITAGGTYEVTITGLSGFRIRVATAITNGPIAALIRSVTGNKSVRIGAPIANPVPTLDQNGAAFSTAVPMSVGTVYAGARSVAVYGSSAGDIILNLVGGGTITLPIISGQLQIFPFVATGFTLVGSTAGAVWNVS